MLQGAMVQGAMVQGAMVQGAILITVFSLKCQLLGSR